MRCEAILALLVALTGCARWSLVPAGESRQLAQAFTVRPGVDWNRSKDGRAEVWTVDGPFLQQLRLQEVRPKETLFRADPRAKMPTYRAGISASEAQEFVTDSLARIGASDVSATGLRPAPFGSLPGFRFELTYLADDGLAKRGAAVGAIRGENLLLVLYTGAASHYFGKLAPEFESIVASITVP